MEKHLKILLVLLFVFAFTVRIVNIGYGLPLWLINDEPSTILGALKMMELKSVIPAFHTEEMASVLYYPPYISYLYLIPFSILYGIQHIFGMSMNAILADLTPYFIIARLISIGAGMLSLWYLYKTSEALFSKKIAYIGTFLAATSLIHIALSFSARHWIFISLIYSLAFYALFRKKNYTWFCIVAGLGMGVSSISILLFALLPLHYFIIEKRKVREISLGKKTWIVAFITAALLILPSLVYPSSNGFIVAITAHSSKTILGIILSPFNFFKILFASEPVVVIAFVLGLLCLYKKDKRLLLSIAVFLYMYSIVYYLMFRYESRFLLPILPLAYMLAGYGISLIKRNTIIAIVLLIPLSGSVYLGYLGLNNDSRNHVLKYAKDGKTLVFGSQLRVPTNVAAIDELEKVDPQALRRVDLAERELGYTAHNLNLYTVRNEEFLKTLPEYVKKNKYNLFIIEQGDSPIHEYMKSIPRTENVVTIGENSPHSIATSEFRGSWFSLFKTKILGPKVDIFK